jgi:hypothetical protein
MPWMRRFRKNPRSSALLGSLSTLTATIMTGDNEHALQLKNKGNELFKKRDWLGAIGQYTLAIQVTDSNPILFANRASCYFFLQRSALRQLQ